MESMRTDSFRRKNKTERKKSQERKEIKVMERKPK
jgi:hypothetical protein